mmetsp:Transcript_42298/g.62208  ORF Transcript_42298/g.62208 Transcript_42298/m.62208 type:complete len:318 (-) Transcript_42298:16-969(-)
MMAESNEVQSARAVVRIVMISDTHGLHRAIGEIPDGDILIHAGDFSNTGENSQIEDFCNFLENLPHRLKIVIAGNHDNTVDQDFYEKRGQQIFHQQNPQDPAAARAALEGAGRGVVYLEDSGHEDAATGLRFWGSPWTPTIPPPCPEWAFNVTCPSATCASKCTALAPRGCDVLVTHGPPRGRRDRIVTGADVGCPELLREVETRIKPILHVFGHIHETYGVTTDVQHNIMYVNPSTCNFDYQPIQPPIVVELQVPYPLDERGLSKMPTVLTQSVPYEEIGNEQQPLSLLSPTPVVTEESKGASNETNEQHTHSDMV